MTRKDIINRIIKICELAEKGVAGEMLNASEKLFALMDKYGITKDELNEKEETNFYLFDTEHHDQLFVQVFHTFFDVKRAVRDVSRMPKKDRRFFAENKLGDANGTLAVECTKAEYVQIVYLFQSFLADYKKQYAAFEYAYYSVNNLLPKATSETQSKDIDKDIVKQAARLTLGVKQHTVNKAIENA